MSKVTTVNTITSLVSALKTAQGGDRIELAAGVYSGFALKDLNFAENVTITSADKANPAVISGRSTLTNVTNLTLDTVTFYNPVPLPQHNYFVNIAKSSGITLSNLVIKGTPGLLSPETGETYPGHSGIAVGLSDRIVIDNLDASVLQNGVVIDKVNNAKIVNSDFHHIRSDGIDFTNTNGLVIENNHFHSFRPAKGLTPGQADHPDFIQYWGTAGGTGLHNIAIRNNVMQQGDGAFTQSIFGHKNVVGASVGGFTNFEVSGNFIQNSHIAGISLNDVVGGKIFDNVLIPSGAFDPENPTSGRPLINVGSNGYRSSVFDTSRGMMPGDIEIRNNITTAVAQTPLNGINLGIPSADLGMRGISVVGNAMIEASSKNAPQFWAGLKLPELRPGQATQDWIKEAITIVLTSVEAEFGLPVDLDGSSGRDVLAGTAGADLLAGGAGDDWLFGRAGADVLVGGAGSDTLFGGDGADQFRIDRADFANTALDQLVDVDFGKGDTILLTGFDSFRFNNNVTPSNALAVQSGGTGVVIDSYLDLLELSRHTGITLTETQTNTFVLRIDDPRGDVAVAMAIASTTASAPPPAPVIAPALPSLVVTVQGGAGNEVLGSGSANDVISGEGGDDVLTGRGGDDVLLGGDGRDRLVGGLGSDSLQGGSGADLFTFGLFEMQGGTVDQIADLDFAGGDRITFSYFAIGTFDESTIATNRMQAGANGTSAIADSLMDLVEIDALSGFAVTRTGTAQLTLSTQMTGGSGQIVLNFVGLDAPALDGFALG